jgi:hypothetical protein
VVTPYAPASSLKIVPSLIAAFGFISVVITSPIIFIVFSKILTILIVTTAVLV